MRIALPICARTLFLPSVSDSYCTRLNALSRLLPIRKSLLAPLLYNIRPRACVLTLANHYRGLASPYSIHLPASIHRYFRSLPFVRCQTANQIVPAPPSCKYIHRRDRDISILGSGTVLIEANLRRCDADLLLYSIDDSLDQYFMQLCFIASVLHSRFRL